MDLAFTAEEQAFRKEVRDFLRTSLPEDIRRRSESGEKLPKADIVRWARTLNDKGWAAPRWPVEYGGPGWTPIQQYIFEQELQAAPAPETSASGLALVGPVIMTWGSDAQKKHFLPRILSHEDWWAQGFSEPGAGSDLASLTMSAKRDGDVYVVNGQKTWTTYGHYADWIFCLVRTDSQAKKQEGISFLLIDMRTPGITIRPIITIEGGHEVNDIFFDGVRVPVENRVGEENQGWNYAKFLLANERVSGAGVSQSINRIHRIKSCALQELDGETPLSEDRQFREKMALLEAEVKAQEIMFLKVLASTATRPAGTADPASSVLKLKGAELNQRTYQALMDIAGPYALPYLPGRTDQAEAPPVGPDFASVATAQYFNSRKITIYGGTNEIQRNIIAKVILGL